MDVSLAVSSLIIYLNKISSEYCSRLSNYMMNECSTFLHEVSDAESEPQFLEVNSERYWS